jgi:hypothetical protein
MLTPQHTFRHSGCATGIEDVQIVGRVLYRQRRRGGFDGTLVIHRAVDQRVTRVVGDLNEDSQLWKVRQHFGYPRRERGMVDQRGRTRIREQILQLTFDVAEVDVERGDSRREGTEQRLDEFVSVVGV